MALVPGLLALLVYYRDFATRARREPLWPSSALPPQHAADWISWERAFRRFSWPALRCCGSRFSI